MALPADFNKIFGSTATGGLTPIGDVNYAKGWEFVGSNPPTKNDFSYLQNLSDLKSQWLYSNKLQRANPFGDIKSDGASAVATALANLGLGEAAKLGVASNSDMQVSPGSSELLTTVAAVMSVLPTRAMSPTDYVRIPDKPGGLIIQWGKTPIIPKASWVDVTFPIPFPSIFLSLMAIFEGASSGSIEYRPYSGASLLTGCQIGEGGAAYYNGSNRAVYIAIGQ